MGDQTTTLTKQLRAVDLFQGLDDDQVSAIAALGDVQRIPNGSSLVEGGGVADTVFAVIEGHAELRTPSETIGGITVRNIGPGESFPLAALVGTGELITSGRSVSEMMVVAIPVGSLRSLCEKDGQLGWRLYANVASILADRYRVTVARLVTAMDTLAQPLGRAQLVQKDEISVDI